MPAKKDTPAPDEQPASVETPLAQGGVVQPGGQHVVGQVGDKAGPELVVPVKDCSQCELVQTLQVRVLELQDELAQAEEALTGLTPPPSVDPGLAPGTPVWLRSSSGQTWQVEVGSVAYDHLLAEGAQPCEAPEA